MSDMIERVAKAIATANGSSSYRAYMGAARAAIMAMREPTEAMILANSDACGPDDQQTIDDWKAMIDVALKPTPKVQG